MKNPPDWIWLNGKLVPWQDANVHVMAHGLHYGSTVFEGIRSYPTKEGAAIFRLHDHIRRLTDSCRMYRMAFEYSVDVIVDACVETIRSNGLTGAYIRPIVFRDAFNLGLCPGPNDPISIAIMAFEWGPLHGAAAIENGCDVCVSSWKRIKSATNPVLAKAGGHYLTSQLISMEAKQNGYDEGIAVDENGNLTEGAGANVFAVKKQKLLTPHLGNSILEGITRDTVLRLAEHQAIPFEECDLPRESLYAADELFMVGTAAEVTPIRSLDRIEIGDGKPGPITRRLQQSYKQVVTGATSLNNNWLTKIVPAEPSSSSDNSSKQPVA